MDSYVRYREQNRPDMVSLDQSRKMLRDRNIKFDKNKLISFSIILLIIFVSVKFHIRYNIERKFIDLENVDKNVAFFFQKSDGFWDSLLSLCL